MLKITAEEYNSDKCTAYMRFTVIFSELILIFSLYLFSDSTISALILLNPGLIYVDSIFLFRFAFSI